MNMPVLDKGSAAQNILSAKGTKKAAASAKGEFDAVLKQTTETGKQGMDAGEKAQSAKTSKTPDVKEANETNEAKEPKDVQQKNDVKESGEAKDRDVETQTGEGKAPELEQAEDLPEDLPEKLEVLERAGGEMAAMLAAQMGLSQETVKAAMEELGMTEVSLLEPKNVKELMVHLTEGADDMSILTDESFYASVAEALDTLEQIVGEVQEETGMEPKEFQAALQEALKQSAAEGKAEIFETPEQAQETEEVQELPKLQETAVVSQAQRKVKADETSEAGNALGQGEAEDAQETMALPKGAQAEASREMPKETSEDMAKEMRKHENAGRDRDSSFRRDSYQAGHMGFRETVEALRAPETESAFPMAQTREIMDQIMDYMKVSVKPEETSLEMQLHPESLGTLHIQISNREGAVTAQFIAQNESVKAALESQIAQLRENLEQQGVKVEAVEVTIAQYSLERNPEGDKGASEQGGKQKKSGRNLNLRELDAEDEEELTQEERLTAQVMQAHGSTVNFTA